MLPDMFLPTTRKECRRRGWDRLDVVLVTGDSYIDSPFVGVAVIGRVLVDAGFKVGIIAQPDIDTDRDIGRLGEPDLFWGVSGGCIDSMVANTTALKKRRRTDDFTPGGQNDRRPDRAVIVYTNLIRRFFKNTRPIVLGGIEASLRRISHYDYWTDRVRRSILFDAKADLLVYGMADETVKDLAGRLRDGKVTDDLPGTCRIAPAPAPGYIELPGHDRVAASKADFARMFALFYENSDPLRATGLCQKQDSRYLIHNPPAPPLTTEALDRVHALPFQHAQHPWYERIGPVRALETIRFSIATHRGCYGECHFCAIAVHQGRIVQSRSEASVLQEAEAMTRHPDFKGNIHDVGGPTANMYAIECTRKLEKGSCKKKRCVFPKVCPQLPVNHAAQIRLLEKLRGIEGIRHVFVASGLRYDMILADPTAGRRYLENLVTHHVSGQLKIAPEHTVPHVLDQMGKPGTEPLVEFKKRFDQLTRKIGKKQFLTYYLIAAHPGCTQGDMDALATFCRTRLKTNPRQVQIFTPTPSTWSSLIYHTGHDPFTGQSVFVEKSIRGKERQKASVVRPQRRQYRAKTRPRR
jgi:uncharacterized radical SAM protein YgiQ